VVVASGFVAFRLLAAIPAVDLLDDDNFVPAGFSIDDFVDF